jgi:hypothetical protein
MRRIKPRLDANLINAKDGFEISADELREKLERGLLPDGEADALAQKAARLFLEFGKNDQYLTIRSHSLAR